MAECTGLEHRNTPQRYREFKSLRFRQEHVRVAQLVSAQPCINRYMMMNCRYCNKECKNKNSHTNHQRLCPKNPDRAYKNGMTGKIPWNKGLSKESDARVQAQADALRGRPSSVVWTSEMRKTNSDLAKANGSGGYRPNAGRSLKYKVTDSFGNEVTLQSSYELSCAKILDALSIKWIRPKALPYDDRKYFPDFYLPDHNLYFDTKNDYLAKIDEHKISKVREQNNVSVLVLLSSMINESYIKNLVL